MLDTVKRELFGAINAKDPKFLSEIMGPDPGGHCIVLEVLEVSNGRRRYLEDIKLSFLFRYCGVQLRLLRSDCRRGTKKLCTFANNIYGNYTGLQTGKTMAHETDLEINDSG